jgi:hypothetical protein
MGAVDAPGRAIALAFLSASADPPPDVLLPAAYQFRACGEVRLAAPKPSKTGPLPGPINDLPAKSASSDCLFPQILPIVRPLSSSGPVLWEQEKVQRYNPISGNPP